MKDVRFVLSSLIVLLGMSLSLAAQAPAQTEAASLSAGYYNTTVGILLGTHKSPDSRFQEVYGSGTSLQFGIDLSRNLVDLHGFQVDLSLAARSLSKTGQATLSGDEAKLSMVPLTVGGLLLYRTKYVIPFVGGGGDWYHYSEKSVLANTSGWAGGYHYQGGLYIVVPGADYLRIKVYYKYTKVTGTANDISVELGGPEYGIGVGYGFNFLNAAALVLR